MKVGIITPWFPTPEMPYGGVFVAQQASALQEAGHEVVVIHLEPMATGPMSAPEADMISQVFAAADAVTHPVPELGDSVRVVRFLSFRWTDLGFQPGGRCSWTTRSLLDATK